MAKDDNGKKSDAESQRDAAMAEWGRAWLEANPPKDRPVHSGGTTFDDLIERHATGGTKGADERLAREQNKQVYEGGEEPAKFRKRKSNETEDAYRKAFDKWFFDGKPKLEDDRLGPAWDKLRTEVKEFMAGFGRDLFDAVGALAEPHNRDIQLRLRGLIRTLEKISAEDSSYDDLKPIHTRSLDNGESILNQVAINLGHGKGSDVAYAAMEFEASDRGVGIQVLWREFQQQRDMEPPGCQVT